MKLKIFTLLLCLFFLSSARKPGKEKVDLVKIETAYGEMVVYLYDSTPIHKANFLQLAKSKFYDGTTFHRIIQGFMIQGGDPNSKDKDTLNDGSGGPAYTGGPNQERDDESKETYTIPAEIKPGIYHRKGVIAAARTGNPARRSSGSQFYIVQGKTYTAAELNSYAMRRGLKLTEKQMQIYTTIGGTPHLDGEYTVFGEVISGMNVVDSIARQKKNVMDRPLTDIKMTMEVVRMRPKAIYKKYHFKIPDDLQVK